MERIDLTLIFLLTACIFNLKTSRDSVSFFIDVFDRNGTGLSLLWRLSVLRLLNSCILETLYKVQSKLTFH